MDIATTILIIISCLACEAFFTGSEIGVVSANRIKLRHDAANGSRGAKIALDMLKTPEWLLSTTLVGTNVFVVTNTTVTTALMIELCGEEYSWLAIVIAAPLIWIFGEIVPKSIFQQNADSITPRAIYILRICSYVFYPILIVFSLLTKLLTRILGGGETHNLFTPREEIVAIMGITSDDTDIEPNEKTMIQRVFDFGETTAADIMVPLIDVVGIECHSTTGNASQLAASSSHKRLTVYDKRVDKITGTLNSLDLLLEDPEQEIQPYISIPIYIPGSQNIADLLPMIRGKGVGMAIIVDEFGGAEGIVTLEDILEVVVGEIGDEHDINEGPTPNIRKLGLRDYIISGRAELQFVEEEVGLKFPDGDYQTIAGFILDIAKEIPPAGTIIRYKEKTLTVNQATPQAIQEVRVTW